MNKEAKRGSVTTPPKNILTHTATGREVQDREYVTSNVTGIQTQIHGGYVRNGIGYVIIGIRQAERTALAKNYGITVKEER